MHSPPRRRPPRRSRGAPSNSPAAPPQGVSPRPPKFEPSPQQPMSDTPFFWRVVRDDICYLGDLAIRVVGDRWVAPTFYPSYAIFFEAKRTDADPDCLKSQRPPAPSRVSHRRPRSGHAGTSPRTYTPWCLTCFFAVEISIYFPQARDHHDHPPTPANGRST